jgi:hypothetical protein
MIWDVFLPNSPMPCPSDREGRPFRSLSPPKPAFKTQRYNTALLLTLGLENEPMMGIRGEEQRRRLAVVGSGVSLC